MSPANSTSSTDWVYVPPEINGGKWLIVAEAPGEKEGILGRPLIGPTGKILDGLIEKIGLRRKQFDLANVFPWRPPNNNLVAVLHSKDERIDQGIEELYKLIQAHDYEYILALGWYSLGTLAGKWGIDEYRGSIYDHHGIPVLGTYHPAYLFHATEGNKGMSVGAISNIILRDFFKFKKLLVKGPPPPTQRDLILFPNEWTDIIPFFERAEKADWMTVDIESPEKGPHRNEMNVIGFALSPQDAICIPYEGSNKHWVKRLLALPNKKVWHNHSFDAPFIQYYHGLEINGEQHDTMLMHRTLAPELPRSLGFCVSIYTDEPYHKDTGKTDDLEDFYRYNALDVATTAQLYEALTVRLKKLGLWETYERDRQMLEIADGMSRRGIRYDSEEAERLTGRVDRNIDRWQKVLDGRAGHPINVYSHPQMVKLLYDELDLPKQWKKDRKTNKWKLTTAQNKLLMLYPDIKDRRVKKILRAVLMIRANRKFKSTYLKLKAVNGRMRTSLHVSGAETGRWSASAFLIDREGTNLQTVPPQWKSCFIADEGKVLCNADYSQIEARLVAYDAQDIEQIKIFEDPNGDIHKENAARMLRKKVSEVTPHERQYLGKSVHAMNYDVGIQTLCEFINKKGLESSVFVTRGFVESAKALYQDTFKKCEHWKNWTWEEGKAKKSLVNYMGRKRIFLGPTTGNFSYITRGEMLAYKPQSTVPDMLNVAMVRISADPVMQECGVELLLQIHDAVLVQGDEDKVDIWVPRLLQLMRVPLTIHGRECIVPTDCKIGKRWSKLKLWKGA